MPLACMGLCGADDSVDPRLLMVLSQQYGWLEWGVLFRPDKEGEPRYASPSWVDRLAAAKREFCGGARLAAHLCSTRVDEVLRGEASFVLKLLELGFGRVQVNATAINGVDMTLVSAPDASAQLLAVIRAVPGMEFILQRNAQTRPLWEPILAQGAPPNVSVLFDESMGTGQVSAAFPPPLAGIRCGFAGTHRVRCLKRVRIDLQLDGLCSPSALYLTVPPIPHCLQAGSAHRTSGRCCSPSSRRPAKAPYGSTWRARCARARQTGLTRLTFQSASRAPWWLSITFACRPSLSLLLPELSH